MAAVTRRIPTIAIGGFSDLSPTWLPGVVTKGTRDLHLQSMRFRHLVTCLARLAPNLESLHLQQGEWIGPSNPPAAVPLTKLRTLRLLVDKKADWTMLQSLVLGARAGQLLKLEVILKSYLSDDSVPSKIAHFLGLWVTDG